jgi:hypothetical protein
MPSVEEAALDVATATKTLETGGVKKDLVFCEAAVPRIGIGLLGYLNNPEVPEWINYSRDLKCYFPRSRSVIGGRGEKGG